MKNKQQDMFGNGAEDTTLFSGTAIRKQESIFVEQTVYRQTMLFGGDNGGCSFCQNTGWIVVKKGKPPKRCQCGAADTKYPVEADELRTLADELGTLYHVDRDILDILHRIANRIG